MWKEPCFSQAPSGTVLCPIALKENMLTQLHKSYKCSREIEICKHSAPKYIEQPNCAVSPLDPSHSCPQDSGARMGGMCKSKTRTKQTKTPPPRKQLNKSQYAQGSGKDLITPPRIAGTRPSVSLPSRDIGNVWRHFWLSPVGLLLASGPVRQ